MLCSFNSFFRSVIEISPLAYMRGRTFKDAYIIAPDGKKICDFQKSNLHVVGYSTPVKKIVSLEELQEHL